MEDPIRVALCGLPKFVEDIVTVLLRDASDVVIAARIGPSDDLRADFDRSGADVLVYALAEDAMRARWRAAVKREPMLAAINLGADATHPHLYAVEPVERALEELTGASLLSALRQQTGRPAGNR